MKKGKSKQNAVIRTMANKNALNFATKRLLRDLKEIECNEIPTVGVTAQPLEEDLFEWHGNVKGPEGTPFEGGVFHIKLNIPESYPHTPPTVTLFQNIPHPNVFGTTICLDMLNGTRKEGIQWTSAYTIQSVLLQLQSFLFEKIYFDEKITENMVKKAVANSNNFRCPGCKHGGKLSAWPAFSENETKIEKFKVIKSNNELLAAELMCYHTKQTYKDVALGIGLNISRVPRTGDIKQANPGLDYISIKAYIKEAIRETSNNERFTHWLPLYFGVDKDRSLYLGKKAISMIFSGSTKRFCETQIVKLFPKILISIGASLMDEKRHPSILILRSFLQIHTCFLLFIENFPSAYAEMEERLDTFLSSPNKRTKDEFPALGDLFAYLLVSKKHKIEEFLKPYFEEQLDRQVFWMLKSVPEFESMDESMDSQRSELTFKSESTAYHITLFFAMIIKAIRRGKENGVLLKEYEEGFGTLGPEVENGIQRECFNILKIKNYEGYHSYLGLPPVDPSVIVAQLKKALTNAKEKKYIGNDDEILSLPPSHDQIKALLSSKPKLEDVITITDEVPKDGGKVVSKGVFKATTDEEFRAKCNGRWDFISQCLSFNKNLTPFEIFQIHKIIVLTDSTDINKTFDYATYIKDQKFGEKSLDDEANIALEIEHRLTWKSLFITLELEERLEFMDHNPDFHFFYGLLSAVKDECEVIIVPYINLSNLKSGYYYITTLLSELTSLKLIYFTSRLHSSYTMSLKFQKAVFKGISNFKENGGKLQALYFSNFSGIAPDVKSLLSKAICSIDTLVSLNFFKSRISGQGEGKTLSAAMISCKGLQELRIQDDNLSGTYCKELADGIMRAKNLRHFDISNNPIDAANLSSIVYNLSFSPRLQSLKIESIGIPSTPALIESLYRLLKISASLTTLSLKKFSSLATNLSLNFYKALGENVFLTSLDISQSGKLSKIQEEYLAKAIAFNFRNGGALTECLTSGIFNREGDIIYFSNALQISKHDYESWYGDASQLNELKGDDYKKTFYCGLKSMDFSNCNLKSAFDLQSFLKKYNPDEHAIVSLFKVSPNLRSLNLSGCFLDKKSMDLFHLAMTDPTKANCLMNLNLSSNQLQKEGAKILATILKTVIGLVTLDISKNGLGVAGAQAIADALKVNSSLTELNISENKIDVDGARAFKDVVALNCNLTYLNLGFNSIRNAGLSAITEGLAANPKSSLKDLEIRSNFLTEDGIIPLLQVLKGSSIERVFIKRNRIGDFGMSLLRQEYDRLGLSLFIDSFEKYNYWSDERLARTIWIQPMEFTDLEIARKFFEDTHKCGIIVDIRKRSGTKWAISKFKNANKFLFIEFAHPFSVTRAMYVATRKEANINGKKFRVFKAGSGCFLYSKLKRSKAKTASITNVLARPSRGGAVRGGRGGARGGRGGKK